MAEWDIEAMRKKTTLFLWTKSLDFKLKLEIRLHICQIFILAYSFLNDYSNLDFILNLLGKTSILNIYRIKRIIFALLKYSHRLSSAP